MGNSQKLIALDLDGTLLADHGNISRVNAAALEQADNAGHIIAVVTGRPFGIIPGIVKKKECIRYIASATGARIWDRKTGRQLANHVITRENAIQICALARQWRCGVLLSYDGRQVMGLDGLGIMVRRRPPEIDVGAFKMAVIWMRFMLRIRYARNIGRYAAACGKPLLKCELIVPDDVHAEDVLAQFAVLPSVVPVISGPHNIEVTAGEATKGNAIAQICALHNLIRAQAIGFGDSGNDMSMREAVGTLVAMGNACEELKAIADYVAPLAGDDGVAKALQHLGVTKDRCEV